MPKNRKQQKKPDWEKYHKWERDHDTERLKKMTPVEKIRILEDLYRTALKLKRIHPSGQ